jgi:hypothetical protein
MWLRSCCCRGRTPGSTLRGSTSWQRDRGGGGQSFERPPPSPAAVRGDGLAALPGGAQRGRGSGPGGLQINEPGISRSLKTLTGSWSELALACLIHVGMKRLMPNEDSELGIGAEYEEAVRLHRAGGKTR